MSDKQCGKVVTPKWGGEETVWNTPVVWTSPSGEVVTGATMRDVLDQIYSARTPAEIEELRREIILQSQRRADSLRK